MITDPFRKISIDMYHQYCKSTLKYEEHWKHKRIYCPVCNCTIVYPRAYEHRLTNKHDKNLKTQTQNAV